MEIVPASTGKCRVPSRHLFFDGDVCKALGFEGNFHFVGKICEGINLRLSYPPVKFRAKHAECIPLVRERQTAVRIRRLLNEGEETTPGVGRIERTLLDEVSP